MQHQLKGKKIKSFNFTRIIGKGAWACVYEAIDQNDNSKVAVKTVARSLIKKTPKLQELIKTEIRVLRECHNQNVIRYVDSFHNESIIFIVTQYCNGGDLQEYLDKKGRLTEDEAVAFLKQILNGFKGLHLAHAMHRDFKTANVLLHNGSCKIADLGFAKQMEKKSMTKTILGTSLTMAPELLDSQAYGIEADIWSIGVVFYQMIFGKYPYSGMSDNQILRKIKSDRPKFDVSDVLISEEAKDFINRCLTVDPKCRISWMEIYNHSLLSKNQILYGLKSKISFSENKDLYKDEVRISEDFLPSYMFKKTEKKEPNQGEKKLVEWRQEQIRESVNIVNLLAQNQMKVKEQQIITEYQNMYIDKRNNIMFFFKFITPFIYSIQDIKANHAITVFIASKHAYIEMKEFINDIKKKRNCFSLGKQFPIFTSSKPYYDLIRQFELDLENIQLQCFSFKEEITNCNSDIKAEFDLDKVYSLNWKKLLEEQINQYWFLLAQNLSSCKEKQKENLIRILEALNYYKNKPKTDIYEFNEIMEKLNFKQAEKKILGRFASYLTSD